MSVIIRIDADSPYGKNTLVRHILSRFRSDFYFPGIEKFGYLNDLIKIIKVLNFYHKSAFIFFRKCTLPTFQMIKQIQKGGHSIGLHLENSRNYNSFKEELKYFKDYFGLKITTFSKHGSGKHKYGLFHYPPYEPMKYISWGKKAGMRIFFGNGENPSTSNYQDGELYIFPSAYWLEPFWRNTNLFNLEWLKIETQKRDIALLFHPHNIIHNKDLFNELLIILKTFPIKAANEIISI